MYGFALEDPGAASSAAHATPTGHIVSKSDRIGRNAMDKTGSDHHVAIFALNGALIGEHAAPMTHPEPAHKRSAVVWPVSL
jgi:hypothetical protein